MLTKKILLAVFLSIASLAIANNATTKTSTTVTKTNEQNHHREISAEQLKGWYDQNKQMTVLDARTKPYFDGKLLPNARWLPGDASNELIQSTIPSNKDSLIVVYCYGTSCPASGWLYEKLDAMGYKNIYEYHGGLQDWTKQGFPINKK